MARKSKGFSELLHHHQRTKGQQQSIDTLTTRVQKNLQGKIAGVVRNPQGEAKMSELLEAFVEPYLNASKTLDQRNKLLTIAAFAWNLALLPEAQQQSELENLIEQLSVSQNAQYQQDMREILEELIERKQSVFRNHKRYIIDFELQETHDDIHLSVVSSMPPGR